MCQNTGITVSEETFRSSRNSTIWSEIGSSNFRAFFELCCLAVQLLSFVLILREIKKARKFERLKCDQNIEYLQIQNVSSEKKWPVKVHKCFYVMRNKMLIFQNPLPLLIL